MRLSVTVDRAAAIRAGRDQYGAVEIQVHPADLTPEEREWLATLTTDENGVTDLTELETLRRAANLVNWEGVGALPERPVLAEVDDPLVATRAWLDWRVACMQQVREAAARARQPWAWAPPAAP